MSTLDPVGDRADSDDDDGDVIWLLRAMMMMRRGRSEMKMLRPYSTNLKP